MITDGGASCVEHYDHLSSRPNDIMIQSGRAPALDRFFWGGGLLSILRLTSLIVQPPAEQQQMVLACLSHLQGISQYFPPGTINKYYINKNWRLPSVCLQVFHVFCASLPVPIPNHPPIRISFGWTQTSTKIHPISVDLLTKRLFGSFWCKVVISYKVFEVPLNNWESWHALPQDSPKPINVGFLNPTVHGLIGDLFGTPFGIPNGFKGVTSITYHFTQRGRLHHPHVMGNTSRWNLWILSPPSFGTWTPTSAGRFVK